MIYIIFKHFGELKELSMFLFMNMRDYLEQIIVLQKSLSRELLFVYILRLGKLFFPFVSCRKCLQGIS